MEEKRGQADDEDYPDEEDHEEDKTDENEFNPQMFSSAPENK